MTREQLQQIRAIVYDAYCEGDTEAGALLVVIDAELAKPEPQPVAWQERQAIGERDGVYKWSHWYSCGYRTDEVVKARARTTQYEWRPLYTAPVATPQQPVSMETVYDTIIEWSTAGKGSRRELARRMIALFATPQREWAELADDEVTEIADRCIDVFGLADLISEALRAKNEEKNT